MNKQLFFSIALLLAFAGSASAMQTVSNYNGKAEVTSIRGVMTARLADGRTVTLDPKVRWNLSTDGTLTVLQNSPVANAPVAPAVAAPKAPAAAQATVARFGGCANGRCQRPPVVIRQGGCQGGRCPARPVAKHG